MMISKLTKGKKVTVSLHVLRYRHRLWFLGNTIILSTLKYMTDDTMFVF
jgi:hypothetical protein